MIKFMLITNDPECAQYAEKHGVNRIFVDLEKIGKKERQGHLDTLISSHEMVDVSRVRSSISRAELLVRVNPLWSGTEKEINEAIEAGADLLMLPMFKASKDVELFADIVGGRVGVIPLVETLEASKQIRDIANISGVVEVYIGLNDLYLDMGLDFIFEPLASGFVDSLVESLNEVNMPFGFGGIARIGEGIVPGELVLSEHLRLGSSSVILSRTFHRKSQNISDFKASMNLKVELEKLREKEKELMLRSALEIESDHRLFQQTVNNFVKSLKK